MSTGYLRDIPPATRARRARIMGFVSAVFFAAFGLVILAIGDLRPVFVVSGIAMVVQAILVVVAVFRPGSTMRAVSMIVSAAAIVAAFVFGLSASGADGGSDLVSVIGLAGPLVIAPFLVHLLSRAVEQHRP